MEELGVPWVCIRRLSPRGRRWPRRRSSRGRTAIGLRIMGSPVVSGKERFCRSGESQKIGDGLERKAERGHQEELHLFIRRANNGSLISREGKH